MKEVHHDIFVQCSYTPREMSDMFGLTQKKAVTVWIMGPNLQTIFHHNVNSIEISFYSKSVPDNHIATKFCTCHDSLAVMACAKFCSDCYVRIGIRAKWIIRQVWIVMGKSLVRWVPCYPYGCMRSLCNTVWSTREETRPIPLTTTVTGMFIVYHMLSNVPPPYLLNPVTLVVINI